MKQIIIKIDINEETGLPQIVVSATKVDDIKLTEVTNPNNPSEKDIKFYQDVRLLVENYKG